MSVAEAEPSGSLPVFGVCFGLAAALIWAAFPVVAEMGVNGSFTAYDIAAIRFGVAGMLLLPAVVRGWRKVGNWPLAVGLAIGAGAPYILVSVGGLHWAPASHAGIILPSSAMLFSILGSRLILGEPIARVRIVGMILLSAGVALVGWSSLADGLSEDSTGYWRGDLMFCVAGALWAGYTIGFRRSGLPPLLATSLVAVISMVAYLPLYAGTHQFHAGSLPPGLLVQVAFQGVLAGIVALLFHTAAVVRLGVGRASAFAGLVPVMAVAMSATVLGEAITPGEGVGLVIATLGLVFALVGGAVTRRRVPERAGRTRLTRK